MTIGEKLKALRLFKNQIQEDVVLSINRKYRTQITREMWAKWETDGNAISLEYAKIVASYFGITLDELAYENKRISKLTTARKKGFIITL